MNTFLRASKIDTERGAELHRSERLKIIDQLDGNAFFDRLTSHCASPEVIKTPLLRDAMDLALEADILFTRPSACAGLPKDPPAGWPGNLKWIQTISAGIDALPRWFDHVPIFTCGRGCTAASISEFVVGTILHVEKRFDRPTVRSPADWVRVPMGGLAGKVIGIAGYGAIGKAISQRLLPFGCTILATRRRPWGDKPNAVEPLDSMNELFARSDHIVLAMPATNLTKQIVNETILKSAKSGIHLINISRGSLIDQDALLTALNNEIVSMASLDVTEPEPLPAEHPFYSHERVRLTPHIAWDGPANAQAELQLLSANFQSFLDGKELRGLVDRASAY